MSKLERFRENKNFALLHQPDFSTLLREDFTLKGKWGSSFFGNDNPIILELGCGRGEYTLAMARMYPDRNFIGIDIKGARLWFGAKKATDMALPNVSFVRTKIDVVNSLFDKGEVSEIWLTFPDPQPAKWKKRLCSSIFLTRYAKFLKPDGIVHLKTDCRSMYQYTKALLAHNGITPRIDAFNVYGAHALKKTPVTTIQTAYEKMFIVQYIPITYLQFAVPAGATFAEPPEFVFDRNVPKAKRIC
jgi:tRNA (guanine-N7-)-methyltransferase